MTTFQDVSKMYDGLSEGEWKRLDTLPMEREITLKLIEEYATARGKIADIGGGPGRIALALAAKGYEVDLFDLSPASIALAKKMDKEQQLLKSAVVANAIDLALEPVYDGVLLLGPLYHLMEEHERIAAVRNAIQAAKHGGYIFCAMITIEAHLRDIAVRDPSRITRQKGFYEKYLVDGRYERPGVQSYHTRLAWIRPFLEQFSSTAQLVRMISSEGFLSGGLDKNISSEDAHAWADLCYKFVTEEEEEHLGNADHIIVVLKKL